LIIGACEFVANQIYKAVKGDEGRLENDKGGKGSKWSSGMACSSSTIPAGVPTTKDHFTPREAECCRPGGGRRG